MRIKYSDIYLNANEPQNFNKSSYSIFFLHGFTGSSDDWDPVLPKIDCGFNKFTVDLLGHGKSDSPNDPALYSWELQVEQLDKVITQFTEEKIILAGYSMGGRLALCYAHTYPERVLGLILESASPGIKERMQREKRIKEDAELAKYISMHSTRDFIELWVNREIFTTQLRFSEEKREEILKRKLRNNQIGLTNSLLGFSTGKMPDLYSRLNDISAKTLLLTGELDTKFTTLNKNVEKLFPSAKHKIIKNAGHTIHLEEPEKYSAAINLFLKNFISNN
jgi:2-succinyl-6-hydroxy-2,4-cyclohexadiene-1-carboxylate synthase